MSEMDPRTQKLIDRLSREENNYHHTLSQQFAFSGQKARLMGKEDQANLYAAASAAAKEQK